MMEVATYIMQRNPLGFPPLSFNHSIFTKLSDFHYFRVKESSYLLYPIRMIEGLKKFYVFNEIERIQEFLYSNEDLIPILYEALEYIYKIFGFNVINFLELHSDSEESWEELFIVIKSPYHSEKARELMDRLGDEWFLNIIDKLGNRLCITEEPL